MSTLKIKYGEICLAPKGKGHPVGTLMRQFYIEGEGEGSVLAGKSVNLMVLFRPDYHIYFVILEEDSADHILSYSIEAMLLTSGFLDWLADNKEKVYPTAADFERWKEG